MKILLNDHHSSKHGLFKDSRTAKSTLNNLAETKDKDLVSSSFQLDDILLDFERFKAVLEE